VVPNNYQADAPTDHIVVAMDGKRAAARALWDAMSLLGEKVRVTVVTVGNDAIAHSDVLMRNLERHQIEAEYRLASRKGSVANSILGIVEEVSADLIVSGSYEHSKFAHSLIGGVSTELMEKTKVPILLSH
jgi:nucleotide-binding universal stress UspA family protein